MSTVANTSPAGATAAAAAVAVTGITTSTGGSCAITTTAVTSTTAVTMPHVTSVPPPAPASPPPTLLRKYLCFAPRPDEWDKYRIAIVQSKAVTKAAIRATLQQLYDVHPQFRCYFNTADDHVDVASDDNNRIKKNEPSTTISSDAIANTTTTTTTTTTASAIPQLRRTGPGRKSNAEYAIQFYEYLLQNWTHNEDEDGDQNYHHHPDDDDSDVDDVDGDDNHDDDDDQTPPPLNREEERHILKRRADDKGTVHMSDRENQTNHDGVEAMADSNPTTDTSKKNRGCEVCRQSMYHSTLPKVQCATCPKVFHTECVRPKWDDTTTTTTKAIDPTTEPLERKNDYQCAYCILASYRRNDKHRKQAAAAVRLMARIKRKLDRQTMNHQNEAMEDGMVEHNHDDDNEEEDTAVCEVEAQQQPSAEEVHPTVHSKPSLEDHDPKGTCMDIANDPETGTPSLATPSKSNTDPTFPTSSTTSPARSSRRCRKQPTLYDPQDGPASRWQTDELTDWKLQRAKEDEEEDAKIQALKASELKKEIPTSRTANLHSLPRKVFRHEKKESGMVCNFCLDDPNIPVCVFCACRTCFGKHCQNELLLCDNCDEEYHIFCLNPPLKCVPASNQPWYCVNCTKREEPQSPTRLSRRGGSDHAKSTSGTTTATTGTTTASGRKSTPTKSMKRPRGRPPKSDVSVPASQPQLINSGSEHSTTDGMINSIISKALSKYNSKNNADSPIKRRPGRPPTKFVEHYHHVDVKPKALPGRKRGRPPSAETLAKRARLEAMARKAARQQAKGIFTSSSSPVPSPSISKRSSSENTTLSISAVPTPTASNDHINSDVAAAAAIPVIISRSGRTVRRSNFHDELAETEQHLKSVRQNSDPSPSPRNTSSIIATNPKVMSASNATTPRSSENKLSISVPVTTSGIEPGPPTVNSQSAGSVAIDPYESMNPFDSTCMKIPGTDLTSVSNLNDGPGNINNTHSTTGSIDHGGYDDNESFDQDEMSATYTASNQNVPIDVSDGQPTTNSTGAMQESTLPLQQHQQHQSQNSLDGLKQPRRKPGARECMQISRRFGVKEIPQQYMDTLLDYCNRGKVEHLIRMRERLDEHSRFLEMQLAGLESLVLENGESDIVVPLAPPSPDRRHE